MRPLHEITVDEIMRQTTLSRKSFYVYFEDRYELLTALFKPLRAELDRANAIWTEGSGDPVGEGRESLMRVAEVIVRDGVLIRALHEASRWTMPTFSSRSTRRVTPLRDSRTDSARSDIRMRPSGASSR